MAKMKDFKSIKGHLSYGEVLWGKRDMTRPRRGLEEGGDPTATIKSLYSDRRIYPDARQHERPYGEPLPTPQWKTQTGPLGGDQPGLINERTVNQLSWRYQKPQGSEDRQARSYENDVPNGWLRGTGEDATNRPFFDHSPKRGKERR